MKVFFRNSNLTAFLIFFGLTIILFRKFLIENLYPIPLDLLVSFYFPWYSGGWEGYNSFTVHKEFIASDAIRQHLPWLSLAFDQLKKGILPLWNPYNFSGTPLLANIQAFIFYPLNIIFFFLPLAHAWSILVIFQFFLGLLFMYLWTQKLKFSPASSLLSGISLMLSSFVLIHLEINIIGHSLMWLPLILYLVENLAEKLQFKYFLGLILAWFFLFLAGAPEIVFYIALLSFAYVILKKVQKKDSWILVITFLLSFLVSLSLGAFQILPTAELYLNSPLGGKHPRFEEFLLPLKNLITLWAPDFFGNPVTGNFWSRLYGDGTPHVGVLALFFAFFSLFSLKDPQVKFFTGVILIALLLALPSPLSKLVAWSSLPIVSGFPPVRVVFILTFALSFLAGFGLDRFLKKGVHFDRPQFWLAGFFIVIYLVLWLFALGAVFLSEDFTLKTNLEVSVRNLILPSSIFAAFLSTLFLAKSLNSRLILPASVIVLSLFGLLYQSNKNLPFSPPPFFYPGHPLLTFLKENAGVNRFYGIDTAHFGSNFATYYQIFSPEGYGILRIKRYADLVASSFNGYIPPRYERADAVFPTSENGFRKRLFDLMGVKYFLDKNDLEEGGWHPEPQRFPHDKVELIWQKGKFKIYERKDVLPRIFLTSNYLVEQNPQRILERIYDPNFNLKQTLILEEEINLGNDSGSMPGEAQLISYKPNEVEIRTKADSSQLLFLSDSIHPGWQALVDGRKTPIYRANYAFRSVVVPAGEHKVVFQYNPWSFRAGTSLSLATLLLLVGFLVIRRPRV